MNSALIRDFTNPDSRFRGKPFWAWNGKLEPRELRRQIRIMKRMGLGGFFMHSRVGLDTPYLSDQWFDCVKACVDEAKKIGTEAWLYDEDRWPSGAAGGLVTRNPAYRAKLLVGEIKSSLGKDVWTKDTMAVFTAEMKGQQLAKVERLSRRGKTPRLGKGRVALVFYVWTQQPNSWYNGQTYIDTMSPEAMREFIRVTHEAYRKQVGSQFGKVIPGIFTDEPNRANPWEPPASNKAHMPWTSALPSVFRKRYGYDVIDRLPEVFFDIAGIEVSQARYHYNDCTTFLFCDSFARQIGEWCDKNRMQHTGHCLAEDTLSSQSRTTGSVMRFYEHMQAPGIDILTQFNREYDTAKCASSVARQFGRTWRLSETYGCTGWDFTFAGHKAVGDWQAALGINLRCQHLSWYTMEGQAKRDYPASIFYQSPWWEHYGTVEDYFARIHAVMTRGEEVRDILVIHPVESAWVTMGPRNKGDERVNALDRSIVQLRDTLLGANLDFDYGDEDIISRHGRVAKRRDEVILSVNKAWYTTVVVPPMVTIRATTLRLLRQFSRMGGTVIFAGKPAKYVDALISGEAVELARQCTRAPAKGQRLVDAIPRSSRRISIADSNGNEIAETLYLLREDRDAFYLFVCNTGRDFRKLPKRSILSDVHTERRTAEFPKVTIRGFDGCKGGVVELDPRTGEYCAAQSAVKADGIEIGTSLPRLGSRLFVMHKRNDNGTPARCRAPRTLGRRKLGGAQWDAVLSEPNVCVLDRPALTIGNGGERKPEEILRGDFAVRDALGIPHRGGRMVQPWAREKKANPKNTSVDLRYIFEVKALPSGELRLALERPELYAVTVNGRDIHTDMQSGWWVDRSLRTLPIDPSILRTGTNEVTLRTSYNENHPGLEIIYLLGGFGVKLDSLTPVLTPAVSRLRLGDWTKQGLPFYSGSVNYQTSVNAKPQKGERLYARVPGYKGVAVRVLVDGNEAGVVGWDPHEIDITDYLSDGGSTIGIEVLGHRRNSHGPLHLNEKQTRFTGPHSYTMTHHLWCDRYNLVPCGLTAQPELVRKR